MLFWQPRIRKNTCLYRKFYRQLAPLVKQWAWSQSISEPVNQLAKADLSEFLHRAKKLLPHTKNYAVEMLSTEYDGKSYLYHMLAVKRELEIGRYDNACHELYDVVHFHYIHDRKVLYPIIRLLEVHLN